MKRQCVKSVVQNPIDTVVLDKILRSLKTKMLYRQIQWLFKCRCVCKKWKIHIDEKMESIWKSLIIQSSRLGFVINSKLSNFQQFYVYVCAGSGDRKFLNKVVKKLHCLNNGYGIFLEKLAEIVTRESELRLIGYATKMGRSRMSFRHASGIYYEALFSRLDNSIFFKMYHTRAKHYATDDELHQARLYFLRNL